MANKKRGPGRMFGPNIITPFLMADKELWAEFIKQEIGDDEEADGLKDLYDYYVGLIKSKYIKQIPLGARALPRL